MSATQCLSATITEAQVYSANLIDAWLGIVKVVDTVPFSPAQSPWALA